MPADSDIDTHLIARIYAALAEDKWADSDDLEAVARTADLRAAQKRMRRAREFHARAALQAVTHSARGVVFGACGYPVAPLPHTEAAEANPAARFAYADASEIVTKVNEVDLAACGRVATCTASLRDPEGLLGCPEVEALPRPLHVQAQMALHFWSPDLARSLFREYAGALPDRSVLLLTWTVPSDSAAGRALIAATEEITGTAVYRHPPETVAGWLEEAGFGIMPPGARDLRGWRLEWPELGWRRSAGTVAGVIARKP